MPREGRGGAGDADGRGSPRRPGGTARLQPPPAALLPSFVKVFKESFELVSVRRGRGLLRRPNGRSGARARQEDPCLVASPQPGGGAGGGARCPRLRGTDVTRQQDQQRQTTLTGQAGAFGEAHPPQARDKRLPGDYFS